MGTCNTRHYARFIYRAVLAFVLIAGFPPRASAQSTATSQELGFTGAMPGQPDGPVALRLRLFNVSEGGAPVFEETQTVTVASERFTARIGDGTPPNGVPATLFHDNPSLWIAFALDSTPDMEIGVRTAITSGGYAHAAQLLTSPMVRTVNGLVGDLVLAAGTNVTITPSGNTLTIAAAGSGGLPSVSHDGTLLGDGTSTTPLGVATPLQLAGNSTAATISGTNSNGFGVGMAGFSPAGYGVRGGTNSGQGVYGLAGSSGIGVNGESSTGTGVRGASGSGIGVSGFSPSAPGVAGASNTANGIVGTTASTTQNVAGVRGDATANSGNVVGVFGTATASPSGGGVVGLGTVTGGYFSATGSSSLSNGVIGTSDSGVGVHGISSTGSAGLFEGNVRVTGQVAIGSGVQSNGGGLKHARVAATLPPGSGCTPITVIWPTPFPDLNYTVSATIQTPRGGQNRVAYVTVFESQVNVCVVSSFGDPVDVILHVIAIHD